MALPFNCMASLYVGDLHPGVNEQMLYEKFSSVGPLVSIRICQDFVTRRSLGYAYVNYRNPADAQRALDTMNFDLINGRPIRIMFSQRDPSLRKSGIGNIFIKNLDTTIDAKSLYDMFSAFGNVLSSKIVLDTEGITKGYGFIHFEDQKAADNAIDKVNGMLLNGKKVYVGVFIPKNKRNNRNESKGFNNIYVKNFGEDLTEEELLEIFQPYGTIISHKMILDEKGRSKGFGFVAFESPESAANAVEELNGELFKERRLYVTRAQKKSERQSELKRHFDSLRVGQRTPGTNVYVKYLDDSIDDDRFCQMFSTFGTILSGTIMKEHGRSKGFGFISYSLPEEATRAIAEMNGKMIHGKPLYVAKAQRKAERIAARQQSSVLNNIQLRAQPPVTYHARLVHPTQNVRLPLSHHRQFSQRMSFFRKDNLIGRLLGLSTEDRRQFLGERLYPKVQKYNRTLVGKITGMFLELDSIEIIKLLENESLLEEKVKEADFVARTCGYYPNN